MRDVRIAANGIDLQIRDTDGGGEPLILLHFGGANLMAWARVVPLFRDRYRLILIDLRGHGRSETPECGYHIEDMAQDVAGVMEAVGLEHAHVIGSSLGAEVGLRLATQVPVRVSSLVCDGALHSESGPFGVWEGTEPEFEAHVSKQLETIRAAETKTFETIDGLIEDSRLMFTKYGWWNPWVEAMVRYGTQRTAEGRYANAWRKPLSLEYMAHYMGYCFEDDYRAAQCPILMVHGEDVFENELEAQALRGLQQIAVNAQSKLVDGWIHPYGWLIDPDRMVQTILEWHASLGPMGR